MGRLGRQAGTLTKVGQATSFWVTLKVGWLPLVGTVTSASSCTQSSSLSAQQR